MHRFILFAATFTLTGATFAQENTGSLSQSTQSEWSSSTTTTTSSSDDDSTKTSDDSDSQSSPEMKAWIKSNASTNSGFGAGFGRDND